MNTALLLCALATVYALIRPVAIRFHIAPFGLLVIIGFVGAELVIGLGGDTGVRATLFKDLVLNILLPILIFESALSLKHKVFFKKIGLIIWLAVPTMIFSCIFLAMCFYYSWIELSLISCLLLGVMLSATDPSSISHLLRKYSVSAELSTVIEAEGGINDVVSIAMFVTLLHYVNMQLDFVVINEIFWQALLNCGYGVAIGLMLSYPISVFWHKFDAISKITLSFTIALASFIITSLWTTSGLFAVMTAGIVIGYKTIKEDRNMYELWSYVAWFCLVVIFLLVGITIRPVLIKFWDAALFGVFVAILARAIQVYVLTKGLTTLLRKDYLSWHESHTLFFTGIRGGVSIALALIVPPSFPGYLVVQAVVYAVVISSLLLQVPLMAKALHKLSLKARISSVAT